jgi:MraZ protein
VFVGKYEHTVDEKGRVFMPAKFREQLGEQFMLVQGMDKCIFVFSLAEWEEFSSKLISLPMTNKQAQLVARRLYSSAAEREPDKQGRVIITAELREYAAIEKDALIIGVGNRAEIWSKQVWEEYNSKHEGDYEEALDSLGI